jgi:hypothetical protein
LQFKIKTNIIQCHYLPVREENVRHLYSFFIKICLFPISWLRKQPLSIARCHGQVITNSHSLYTIGGCTEHEKNHDDENKTDTHTMSSLNLLYKYDPHLDKWIILSHMKQARHDFCAEIIGMIYLLNILLKNCVFDMQMIVFLYCMVLIQNEILS